MGVFSRSPSHLESTTVPAVAILVILDGTGCSLFAISPIYLMTFPLRSLVQAMHVTELEKLLISGEKGLFAMKRFQSDPQPLIGRNLTF
jgi:hypothetical protein